MRQEVVCLFFFCLLFQPVQNDFFSDFWNKVKGWTKDTVDSVKATFSDVEKWDCGADKFWITKLITQRAAKSRCKSIFDSLNQACRYHDFCYNQGIDGQRVCDDKFCAQLFSLPIMDPAERESCTLPGTMCDAVRIGGALVYQDKANEYKQVSGH